MIRLGDIVTYRLTTREVNNILSPFDITGFHGNHPRVGEEYPLLVVRINTEHNVNGQVFLDGNKLLWVASAEEGFKIGQWYTPDTKQIDTGIGRTV